MNSTLRRNGETRKKIKVYGINFFSKSALLRPVRNIYEQFSLLEIFNELMHFVDLRLFDVDLRE